MQGVENNKREDERSKEYINGIYPDSFIAMIKSKKRFLEEKSGQEYRKLKTVLLKSYQDCKVLLIVSSLPGEGCTGVALNLAKELSSEEGRRTIIIDANLRNPRLFNSLRIRQKDGFFDILRDMTIAKAKKMVLNASSSDRNSIDAFIREAEKAFEEIVERYIQRTNVKNLMAISSGMVMDDNILSSENENIGELIKYLRKSFDYILIDCAPANLYSDSLLIAPHADGIILVVEAERTRREVIGRVIDEFKNIDRKIIGVVLNKQRYYIPESIYKLI